MHLDIVGAQEVVTICKLGEGECDSGIGFSFLRICPVIILFKPPLVADQSESPAFSLALVRNRRVYVPLHSVFPCTSQMSNEIPLLSLEREPNFISSDFRINFSAPTLIFCHLFVYIQIFFDIHSTVSDKIIANLPQATFWCE